MAPLHVATLTVQREQPELVSIGSLPYLCTKNDYWLSEVNPTLLCDLFQKGTMCYIKVHSLSFEMVPSHKMQLPERYPRGTLTSEKSASLGVRLGSKLTSKEAGFKVGPWFSS